MLLQLEALRSAAQLSQLLRRTEKKTVRFHRSLQRTPTLFHSSILRSLVVITRSTVVMRGDNPGDREAFTPVDQYDAPTLA